MFGIALIVFRETLEAALFVGIVAAATRGVAGRGKWLGAGVAAGIAGSLALASMAGWIGELAEGTGQDLVNAGILGVAFLMLGMHVIWAARHGMHAAGEARAVGRALQEGGAPLALSVAVAMSVLREGAETVLFVGGYMVGNGQQALAAWDALAGCVIGVVSGAALGGLLYLGLSRIPMRRLFAVTNLMILLLAAAMAGQLARVLGQAGLLTHFAAPVWDTGSVLPADSAPGSFLHALVGYDAQPSGMQLIFYVAGMLLILGGMRLAAPAKKPRKPEAAPMASGHEGQAG
jgi:high-affinity iron transporter